MPVVEPTAEAVGGEPRASTTVVEADRAAVYAVLSSRQDSQVQEVVDLLRNICQVEIAAVTVPHRDRFHHLVTAGADPVAFKAADSLCQHTMFSSDTVIVPDASVDERFSGSPLVDGRSMSLRFLASSPIRASNGTTLGRLCLFDSQVKELTAVQRQALDTLATSLSSTLDLQLRRRDIRSADELSAPEGPPDEVMSVASQVSHDLRAPLTALATSLALLEESTPRDETPLRRSLLASATRSSTRMAGLVDGLLRLNDVHRGLVHSDVDLLDTAREVVVDLDDTLREVGGTVTMGDLPVVRADADLISAALANLVGNSVKFARPGTSPVIHIYSRPSPHGTRVIVRDNGVGVPPEDRQRVFALFSRLSHAPGHGIGLTTVARIARAHDGSVGIDDTPDGVGIEVWFEIPG